VAFQSSPLVCAAQLGRQDLVHLMTKIFQFEVDIAEERTGLNPLAAAVQAQNKVSFKGLHHPNQILHPYFSYGHPFSAASWYYANGLRMFADVRWVGFLPPCIIDKRELKRLLIGTAHLLCFD